MEDLIDLFLGKFTGREETGEDASVGRNSQPLKALEAETVTFRGQGGREEAKSNVLISHDRQSRRPRRSGGWREWSRS